MTRRFLAFIPLILALAGIALSDPPKKPRFMASFRSSFAFGDVKKGQWANYTTKGGLEKKEVSWDWTVRCVDTGKDELWIETDDTVAAWWPGTVMLLRVDPRGRVKQAWWGKPGESGEELECPEEFLSAMPPDSYSGTIETADEDLTVGGKKLKCERITLAIDEWDSSMRFHEPLVRKVWLSPEVPFPQKPFAKPTRELLKWEVEGVDKPKWAGGLVKEEITRKGWSSVTELKEWGDGAERKLKVPERK